MPRRLSAALNSRYAFPAALIAAAVWQAAIQFVILADHPLLYGDSPIYLVSGLRPFETDWRALGGMHAHPIANPGILLWPLLKLAGCEWGGGDLAACSWAFKAYVVPVSLAPLAALYWLSRRWLSQPWALFALGMTAALSNGYHVVVLTGISTAFALSAALIMFRAVLDYPDRRRRWLIAAMPVVCVLTSISAALPFAVLTLIALAHRARHWRTLAPPLAVGGLIGFAVNLPLYPALLGQEGGLIIAGLEQYLPPPFVWRVVGDLYWTAPLLMTAVIAAVAMLFTPRYRPLGVAVLALYICASWTTYDRAIANLNLRSAQMLTTGVAAFGVIGANWTWSSKWGRRSPAVAAVLLITLFAVGVGYKPMIYLTGAGIEDWRNANNVHLMELARDYAGEREGVRWIFPSWQESVLYSTLYERTAVHSSYGSGGNYFLATNARIAVGAADGDMTAAIERLGATHIFALYPAGNYGSWGHVLRDMWGRIADAHAPAEECWVIAERDLYCIFEIRP